jgi:hypothetical protein
MHMDDSSGLDARRVLLLKLTAQRMSPTVQRDLVEYWGRRQLERRPSDWT